VTPSGLVEHVGSEIVRNGRAIYARAKLPQAWPLSR
jgi:hypothetical protein